MKLLYCFLGISLGISIPAFSQDLLVFKGTVRCYIENDPQATKGAKNLVVVPGFIPAKAGMTGPQGYYELNTAVPLQKLEGKYVVFYYISSCKQCEVKKSVFVSEDQVRPANNKNLALTIETILMNAGCKNTELGAFQSDSIYNSFVRMPGQDLEKISALNVVTATPGFLNLLTNAVSVVAIGGGGGTFFADTAGLAQGKINGYGNFLFASPMILTGNTGFNFSPHRDLTESTFWNPSALAGANQKGGVHLFTNLKNNGKLSAFAKINDQFTIGAGGIYTEQDNFRSTRFRGGGQTVVVDSHFQKLKEYAAFLAPAYKVNNKLSVGIALKSIWQNFTIPQRLELDINSGQRDFFDSTVNRQKFDVDVSFSYNLTRSLKAGLNLMNLAGTKLYADAFPAGKKNISERQLRSFGLGLCYKWKQFNFGTDVLITEDDLYDVTVGINYIPFNNALLAGGFAFKQQSFSLSFKMKYFRLSYVNDNDLMVNEKRKGKIDLLNGQLYTGLAFVF